MRAQEIKRKRISHPIYLRKTNFITFDLFVTVYKEIQVFFL